jgi:xanthine dehydrogenase YagT iron-sulfur-binding subunit
MMCQFACTEVELVVNGTPRRIAVDVRQTLLDLLRERLHLTGTKKGCDHGLCGACTVTVDGERVLSCLTLAASITGRDVRTIEGAAGTDRPDEDDGGDLSPVQRAFVEHDGFQCGYCTSGQVSSAQALLREHARGDLSTASFECRRAAALRGDIELTRDEIRERMAGNICRCGAQANIVAAIADVASAS